MSQDIFGEESDCSFGWIPLSGQMSNIKKEIAKREHGSKVVHKISESSDSIPSSDDERTRKTKRFKPDPDGEIRKSPLGKGTSETESIASRKASQCSQADKLEESRNLNNNNAEILSLEDFSSDDEVWLVQCPVRIAEKDLKNQCFPLSNNQDFLSSNGNCHLKVKVSPATKKTYFSCLLPSKSGDCFKPVVLPSAGHLVLTTFRESQQTKEASLQDPTLHRKVHHSLPTNLKLRHPLLGIDF